jgi:hypothetical protein
MIGSTDSRHSSPDAKKELRERVAKKSMRLDEDAKPHSLPTGRIRRFGEERA